MTQEITQFTKSALVDKIRVSWRMKKTFDFPIAGDYYYKIIDEGILFKKEIEIPLSDFDEGIKKILDKEKPKTVQYIIFRAIKEIAQEKFGNRDYEDLIKWRLIE
ncbi:MAG: hypothetical protein WD018_05430 [Nitrosopumilaceae archaeon]